MTNNHVAKLGAQATGQPPAIAPTIALLGVPFDNVTLTEALARITSMIESRRPHHVVTANVDFLVQARKDVQLHRIISEAHLVVCDGTPLIWASRLLRNPLPERVAGADLVPQLLAVAAQRGYRVFFLGASQASNQRAVQNVRARFNGIKIVGHYSPPFRPLAEMNNAEIIRRIREAQPDVVLVAFGCPKAEKWIARHFQSLGVPVMMGIGATLDFLAGNVRRAPEWMQRCGLEWFFRLIQEPKRLFHRYAADLWHFATGLARQWWQTLPAPQTDSTKSRHCIVTTRLDWIRVQLPERLDTDAVCLGEWLWKKAARQHCVLDLRNVQFMDSTGVGLLMRLHKELSMSQKNLVLASPSNFVKELLRFMGLSHYLAPSPVTEASLKPRSMELAKARGKFILRTAASVCAALFGSAQ